MAWNTRRTYQAAAPCSEPVPIGTLPAGYSITLPNLTVGQPLMLIDHPPGVPMPSSKLGEFQLGLAQLGPSRNPQVGSFIRPDGLIAGTLGQENHNAPAYAPDGRIGRLVIGRSPIGRRPTHKDITLGAAGGDGETER